MESIERTVSELSNHFKTTMAEFQQSLDAAIPTGGPATDLATQFSAFRSFVLSALEGLQKQVELLTRQADNMEMRSRRKILLVHGIAESSDDNVASTVVKVLSDHLKLPNINLDSVSRCQRLGQAKTNKPRAVLIKFKDLSLKNKVWFAKSRLKGSGVTVSEFLTKERHDAFMAARQHFGVSKCWTMDGNIVLIRPDGARHRIMTMADFNEIVCAPASQQEGAKAGASAPAQSSSMFQRPKRSARK